MVVQAKPSYYANRGTFSLAVREIRMVGLGELLARLERRRQLLAAEGLFARELKRSLPFLPHRVGLVTAPRVGRRARRARQRAPPLAERRLRGRPRHHAGPARRRRGDGGAGPARAAPRRRRDRRRARRRLGRGPAAVLRRGAGPGRARLRTPVVSAIGHEQDQPLLDLVADVRASTPTDAAKLVVPDVAEELRLVDVGPAPAPAGARRLARPRAGRPRRAAVPAGARRPARPARRARRRGRTSCATGPAGPSATGSTAPHDDIAPPAGPGPGAVTAGHPGARVRRAPGRRRSRGHLGGRRSAPKAAISVRVADGRVHATTHPHRAPRGDTDG